MDNINEVNGVASMAYNAENGKPWHSKGQAVQGLMTSAQVLEAAKLGYTVAKQPIYTKYQDSNLIEIPEQYATIRTDTMQVLGTVKGRYEVLQNAEAFSFFDVIVGEGKAIYESAGALGLGETIWLLAKLPSNIEVTNKDIVETYLMLSTSHDGSSRIRARFTPVRIVCQNTLYIALSGVTTEVSIKHTKSMKHRLEQAHKLLGIVADASAITADSFRKMQAKTMVRSELDKFLEEVYTINPESECTTRRDNIVSEITDLFYHGKGNNGATVWDGLNAVTEYVDHKRSVHEGTDLWESAVFGSGVAVKERAFNAAMALV